MERQTTVFLLRHGDTNFRYIPVSIIDQVRVLSPLGRKRLKKVGEYLDQFSPSLIVTSPVKRCRQTAEIIKKAVGLSGYRIEPALGEIYSFGDFNGLANGGLETIKRIVFDHNGETVVIVSHGLVIRRLANLLGAGDDELTESFQMAQMYQIIFAGDRFVSCRKLSPGDAV